MGVQGGANNDFRDHMVGISWTYITMNKYYLKILNIGYGFCVFPKYAACTESINMIEHLLPFSTSTVSNGSVTLAFMQMMLFRYLEKS